MRLSVIGGGYVATTIAACFADLGHEVTVVDPDGDVVEAINGGTAPVNEDGLDDLVAEHAGEGGRLGASTDYDAVRDADVTFLCLPTPQNLDGSIDLSAVEAGAERVGRLLGEADGWHTVVVQSTVIPGSTEDVVTAVVENESGRAAGEEFGVGMTPEFLGEGTAVHDFMHPDMVVLGADHERALEDLRAVFDPLVQRVDPPVVETDARTAEMIKYAHNSYLAAKVSLSNDVGNVCKEFDVDAYEVAAAIGLDDRIGSKLLRSGLGWGGSAIPKDLAVIREAARSDGYTPAMLDAAAEVNETQPRRLLSFLDRHVDVVGERVAVLGLAFRPGTDVVENSPAIPVVEGLLEREATVVAYDPAANESMRERYPDVTYASTAAEALEGAAAALVVTDWAEIRDLDEEFDAMSTPVVVDGRHAIDRRAGLVYEGLTW